MKRIVRVKRMTIFKAGDVLVIPPDVWGERGPEVVRVKVVKDGRKRRGHG